MKEFWKFLALFSLSFNSDADIFGVDDRRYVFPRGYFSTEATGVSVGVLRTLWTDLEGEQVNLLEESPTGRVFGLIQDSMSDILCRSEKFSRDPSISYACTGFLIAPDLLITAGHCAVNAGEEISHEKGGYCEAYTWYFDYQNSNSLPLSQSQFLGDKIFKCEEIIYAINEQEELGRDFALIRLKRKVPDTRHIFQIDNANDLNLSSRVNMLGHPMGTPLKISPNGRILEDHSRKTYLKTNLDAFAGNSGSPVLNRSNHAIGVLVAGKPNFGTYKTPAGCEKYNRCDGRGANCIEIPEDSQEGFPHTYSKVQKLDPYRRLIEAEKSKSLR
ncbi:MAG: hypothetical protein CME65_10760 [Halobacteriovoraceae bacterium]|nr:hypothetical protein [Halobacteriovoraceae bacterium]|tara:strand:+ start:4762 stop:5751 length:990 start_codon:yes stop_codon:yes gene_type:complete